MSSRSPMQAMTILEWFHRRKSGFLLPCPYGALDRLGYCFERFLSRTALHNVLLTRHKLRGSYVILGQVPKDSSSKRSKPYMKWTSHRCGLFPLTYFSLDCYWVFVSPELSAGDVPTFVDTQRLSPGFPREQLMQRLACRLLPQMAFCHQLGLHHGRFDWTEVFLDEKLVPVWAGSWHYLCASDADRKNMEGKHFVQAFPMTTRLAGRAGETLDAIEALKFGASLIAILLNRPGPYRNVAGNLSADSICRMHSDTNAQMRLDCLEDVFKDCGLSVDCQLFLEELLGDDYCFQQHRLKLHEFVSHPWVNWSPTAETNFRSLLLRTTEDTFPDY